MKSIIRILLTVLVSIPAMAQEAEMADTMRSNGKIYVVVAILLVILGGLIGYLVTIDRKASRLEKRVPPEFS